MARLKISLKGESEERSKDTFNFTNFIIKSFADQEGIHEKHFHKLNPEVHPLIKAAVRKYRILSQDYEKFHSDVYDCLRALNFGVSTSHKTYNSWDHPKWRMKSILIRNPDKNKGAKCFTILKSKHTECSPKTSRYLIYNKKNIILLSNFTNKL